MFPPSDSTACPFPQGRSLSSITDTSVISKQPFSVRRPCVGRLGCADSHTFGTTAGEVGMRTAAARSGSWTRLLASPAARRLLLISFLSLYMEASRHLLTVSPASDHA